MVHFCSELNIKRKTKGYCILSRLRSGEYVISSVYKKEQNISTSF